MKFIAIFFCILGHIKFLSCENLEVVFSLSMIDEIMNKFLAVNLQNFLKTIEISGPIHFDEKIALKVLKGEITKIKVKNFDINWAKSRLFATNNRNEIGLQLDGLDLDIDSHLSYKHYFNTEGDCEIKITKLDLTTIMNIEQYNSGTNIRLSISKFEFKYKDIKVNFFFFFQVL